MEKLIGNLESKSSGTVYPILWDSEERTVWRIRSNNWKELIAYNAPDETSAIKIAREFLDLQI